MRAHPGGQSTALIIVNSTEALYNLGRWRSAERICRSALRTMTSDPLAVAGLKVQLAWIVSRSGEAGEARALLSSFTADAFPRPYQAEYFFAQSACALALGEVENAHRSLDAGEALVMRASSRRNALFLRAEIFLSEGRLELAEGAFRAGTEHVYQGQGGHSLAAWAVLLEKQGRLEEAVKARALVLERDPQSESARLLGGPRARCGETQLPVLEVRTEPVVSAAPRWVTYIGLSSSAVLLVTGVAFAVCGVWMLYESSALGVVSLVASAVVGQIAARVGRRAVADRLLERDGPRWQVPVMVLSLMSTLWLVALNQRDDVSTLVALCGFAVIGVGWGNSLGTPAGTE